MTATMSDTDFTGEFSYDQTTIDSYFSEELYNYTTTFYFSGVNTTITSRSNAFENLIFNKRGGVFDLQQTTLIDEDSIYKRNSALLGGAIACWLCTVSTEGSTFKSNYAINAGAIYFES